MSSDHQTKVNSLYSQVNVVQFNTPTGRHCEDFSQLSPDGRTSDSAFLAVVVVIMTAVRYFGFIYMHVQLFTHNLRLRYEKHIK